MFQDNIHNIKNIEFGILSAEDIKKLAVCKIDSSKISGHGSVYDERMGCSTDTNEKCVTCGLKKECWGHFGYIELAEPILHPMYYKMISTFLKCFCKQCHKLLVSEEQLEISNLLKLKNERRFNKILEKIEKIDICHACNSPQPKIIYKTKDMIISMEYKEKKLGVNSKVDIVLNTEDIKKIFDNVSDKDVKLLGFNPRRIHPKSLILTVLPVIPPCSRPYVIADGNICDDDLTYQIMEIVKINNQLLNEPEITEQKRQKLIQSLKFRVATSFNNSKGKAKHPTDSRALKGLKERLAGKGGRLRNNLMGKRVDYSARTVIGSEPTLKLDQVGVPYEITKIHTKPEFVTPYNIDWLTEIVNNNKANFLNTTKEDGTKIRINLHYALNKKSSELLKGDIILKNIDEIKTDVKGNVIIPKNIKSVIVETGNEVVNDTDKIIRNKKLLDYKYAQKNKITLKVGDVVERHLIKGDIVLMNRQPTLHKGSMLALEVVPMPYKTFRFNLGINKSLNADFDGDEMNLHSVQSYETEAELRNLSMSTDNIISGQESKPIISITQDSLNAVFLMTKKDFKLSRNQFFDLCMKGQLQDGSPLWNVNRVKHIEKVLKQNNKKPDIFNGRGLLSLILPQDLYYERKNSAHPTEDTVIIKEGVILEGAFDKTIVGNVHNSLIQILHKEYGVNIVTKFIDNIHFLGNNWLLIHGFSIGLEDCMITSQKSSDAIKDTLIQYYTKAEGIENTTQNPGIREVRVTATLSQAKDIGMKIAKDAMKADNNFLVTVTSGSKGDFFNIAQITGLLGQQNLEGKRVNASLNHGTRTLPHYPFGKISKEKEYESKGFIKNSFIKGLCPQEFFFHAMSGREGVCDTAMGTAKSGYIQRKIVKVCEDIQVKYDQTVRDTTGKIYQFCYGENNYDPTKTVKVDNNQQVCDIYRLVDRLNKNFENGHDENIEIDTEPKIKFTEIVEDEIDTQEILLSDSEDEDEEKKEKDEDLQEENKDDDLEGDEEEEELDDDEEELDDDLEGDEEEEELDDE
jgi:DNA-directed RNA polymerase beta' subunit